MTWRERLLLAASAGVGAAFGFLCFQGYDVLCHRDSSEQVKFLIVIILLFAVSALFLDPLLAALHRVLGRHDNSEKAALIPTLALLLAAIVLGELFTTAAAQSPVGATRNVISAIVLTGGITAAWTSACKDRFRRAWLWGLIYGLLAGTVVVLAFWIVHDRALMTGDVMISVPLGDALRLAISNGLLYWGPLGLVGGLALRWPFLFSRRWLVALAIVSAGFLLD
ncbi:MAG: hypothetical protein WCD75_05480, partial [Rhodoplanes sp.]